MDPTAVIKQVDALLGEHQSLRSKSQYDDLSDLNSELHAFDVTLRAAIDRLAPPASSYRLEAQRHEGLEAHRRVPRYVGILTALRADVQSGWMQTVSELLHADTFSDILDQAEQLLDKNYKDAGAVVSGTALESHLRLLAQKAGLDVILPSGATKKADSLNADLAKAGIYGTIQQKSVTAWLGIRNAAAHGEYEKYGLPEVRQMLAAVRDFIGRYPA